MFNKRLNLFLRGLCPDSHLQGNATNSLRTVYPLIFILLSLSSAAPWSCCYKTPLLKCTFIYTDMSSITTQWKQYIVYYIIKFIQVSSGFTSVSLLFLPIHTNFQTLYIGVCILFKHEWFQRMNPTDFSDAVTFPLAQLMLTCFWLEYLGSYLPWNLLHIFKVPTGWNLLTLVITWLSVLT